MLYTGKGDDGTTKSLGNNGRISKSSLVPECLGTLDELNSFLGIVKVHAEHSGLTTGEEQSPLCCLIHEVQQNLFIVQSGVAGSEKVIEEWKVQRIEMLIHEIEQELPLIKTFVIAGGTELSALLDYARTLVRRAERGVVAVHEQKEGGISEHTLSYMNRLSSFLFALARLVNQAHGITEDHPDYR